MEIWGQIFTGCCPNHFERSLKGFCPSILAKWKISALNLFESRWQAGRVFKAPATSFRLIKNVLDKVKKDLGNSPFTLDKFVSLLQQILDSVKDLSVSLLIKDLAHFRGQPVTKINNISLILCMGYFRGKNTPGRLSLA
jgi:hypothetical protein